MTQPSSAATTLTALDPVVKTLWPQSRIENQVYQGAPLLAMLKKNTGFYGDVLYLATQYGNPQGRSRTFTDAQDNASASKTARYALTRVTDYGYCTVSDEAIEASASNKGALVKILDNEVKSMLAEMGRNWHTSLYRATGGARGVVGSLSSTRIVLATIEDIVNFEVNMELKADTVDGGGTVHTGSATVTAIDRDNGYLISDATWTSQIADIAAADYLFVEGDYGKSVAGLRSWLPQTAPTSGDSFFGLDRSTDVVRLAGNRYNASSDTTIQEALLKALSKIKRNGKAARPTHLFMNEEDFTNLVIELGSKVQYVSTKVAGVGFDGCKLPGGIEVYPDFGCPKGECYFLMLSTFEWHGLTSKVPHLVKTDGNRYSRLTGADGIEFRARLRGQLGCVAPGYSGVVYNLPS